MTAFLFTLIAGLLIGGIAVFSVMRRQSRPRVELDETERWL